MGTKTWMDGYRPKQTIFVCVCVCVVCARVFTQLQYDHIVGYCFCVFEGHEMLGVKLPRVSAGVTGVKFRVKVVSCFFCVTLYGKDSIRILAIRGESFVRQGRCWMGATDLYTVV